MLILNRNQRKDDIVITHKDMHYDLSSIREHRFKLHISTHYVDRIRQRKIKTHKIARIINDGIVCGVQTIDGKVYRLAIKVCGRGNGKLAILYVIQLKEVGGVLTLTLITVHKTEK